MIRHEEKDAIDMVLRALRGGLYSKSPEVAAWTAKVLARIARDLADSELVRHLWDWFLAPDGGLDSSLYCLQKHCSETQDPVVAMMMCFGGKNVAELFIQFLHSAVPDESKYLRLVSGLVKSMSILDEEAKTALSPVLLHWVDSALRVAESDGRHSSAERAVALGLAAEIWVRFPAAVESKDEVADHVLGLFRTATRDKSLALQTFALAQLFGLLEILAGMKKRHAPVIYKSLAVTFIEAHQQESVREFIMGNMTAIFAEMASVPVGIMADQMVRQVQTCENVTYFFNLFDFQFLKALAVHPKLEAKTAVEILDMLAKKIAEDRVFAEVALQLFVRLATRFRADPAVSDLLSKFVSVCSLSQHTFSGR